jgi:two-component system, NarL family, sensor histidine kinase UhpB
MLSSGSDADALHSTRVLLVDDDLIDRMACRRALTACPEATFELLEAETGEDGIAIALAERPDCILLDYQLPDLNGSEFLSLLGKEPGRVQIPVLLLTGSDSTTIVVEAMRRGAWDYLGKDGVGHYLELLPAAILRMLRERRLAQEKWQAEIKFQNLVEQIPAITYLAALDSNGHTTYVSPQVRNIGYTPDDWLGSRELRLSHIHPDDRERVRSALCAIGTNGGTLSTEYRLLTRGGQTKWFRDEARILRNASGEEAFMQGILTDITDTKISEEALRKSHEQLRNLAAHLEAVKEEERARIAREIHDELGGLLTGIKAYISVFLRRNTMEGESPDTLLGDAMQLTDEAMQAMRRVITDLRPSVLDELGIWAALEWYTEQTGKRAGLPIACVIGPEAAALQLDPQRSTMVFRIVQEALTNATRHASASRVVVRVTRCGDWLLLEVEDNGKGIDLETGPPDNSWGIVGMHERTRHFGGNLRITSQLGKGTVVTLQIPVEKT